MYYHYFVFSIILLYYFFCVLACSPSGVRPCEIRYHGHERDAPGAAAHLPQHAERDLLARGVDRHHQVRLAVFEDRSDSLVAPHVHELLRNADQEKGHGKGHSICVYLS